MGKELEQTFGMAVEDLEGILSTRSGKKIKLNQIANQVYLYEVIEVGNELVRFTEQELLASANPVNLLADALDESEEIPDFGIDVILDQSLLTKRAFLPTTKGGIPLVTIASDFSMSLAKAGRSLSKEIQAYRSSGEGEVTVVSVGDVHQFSDYLHAKHQFWINGAVLDGCWAWDPETEMLVEMF